jgi:hypothetical protein
MKTNNEIKGREWIMDILEPYAKEGNMNITFKGMVGLIMNKILPKYASQRDTEPKEEGKGAEENPLQQSLIDFIHTEFKWYEVNSPDYGVIPQIIKKWDDIKDSLPAKQSVTDEEIESLAQKVANDCSSDRYHRQLIRESSKIALKAMRDGQIPKK